MFEVIDRRDSAARRASRAIPYDREASAVDCAEKLNAYVEGNCPGEYTQPIFIVRAALSAAPQESGSGSVLVLRPDEQGVLREV
jgi:hypothetical protein